MDLLDFKIIAATTATITTKATQPITIPAISPPERELEEEESGGDVVPRFTDPGEIPCTLPLFASTTKAATSKVELAAGTNEEMLGSIYKVGTILSVKAETVPAELSSAAITHKMNSRKSIKGSLRTTFNQASMIAIIEFTEFADVEENVKALLEEISGNSLRHRERADADEEDEECDTAEEESAAEEEEDETEADETEAEEEEDETEAVEDETAGARQPGSMLPDTTPEGVIVILPAPVVSSCTDWFEKTKPVELGIA